MSLLDDVSIVVTPNGYKAGELYAVIPVPTEGAELVPSVASIVNAGGGTITQISGNSYSSTSDGTSGSAVRPKFDLSTTAGKRYKLTITPTGTISGTVNFDFYDGSSYLFQNYDFTTTKEIYFIDNGSVFGAFDGTQTYNISSFTVSVKEYTAADMDVTRATAATRVDEDGLVNYAEIVSDTELVTNGDFASDLTGWTGYGTRSATGGIATIGASANSGIYQGVLTQGVRYTVTVNVTSYDGVGTAQFINDNGANLYTITAIGIQTFTFIHTISSSNLILRGVSNALFSLSSVSVKELTRDNVPRIDYTGGGCPHILAEPQRTNLLTYSEDFSQSDWTKQSNTTPTYNTTETLSPDGTYNATKLVGNGTDGIYKASISITGVAARSVYLKSVTGTVNVKLKDPNATITTLTLDVTNEWQRFDLTEDNGSSGQGMWVDDIPASGIYMWGAQIEEDYPTSYIPTSGSTVTRNQDIFTRDGIGSLINSTEGTLVIEPRYFINDGSTRKISISDGTATNRIYITPYQGIASRIRYIFTSGGTTQADLQVTGIDITISRKLAFVWKTNRFELWQNGSKISEDTSGTTPSAGIFNQIHFGSETGNGSNPFEGELKQLQVYTTALTDTQLAALTS